MSWTRAFPVGASSTIRSPGSCSTSARSSVVLPVPAGPISTDSGEAYSSVSPAAFSIRARFSASSSRSYAGSVASISARGPRRASKRGRLLISAILVRMTSEMNSNLKSLSPGSPRASSTPTIGHASLPRSDALSRLRASSVHVVSCGGRARLYPVAAASASLCVSSVSPRTPAASSTSTSNA